MNTKELSVFFPCINEEGNVENIVAKAESVLKKLKLLYEIIIVNDGSTDKTGPIAEGLAKKNPHIKVIHHPKNLGYGEALKSGFYSASYDTIVYTDGDGQFDFAEVTKFLEKIKDSDVVIGIRMRRQDSFLRKLFGKGWRLALRTFFGLTLKDVDCGFKMVRRSVLEKISHLESQRGAMINAELAIKAKKAGFKISEVGVNHYPRISGKPTGANIKVIIKSFLDLLRLWWKLEDEKWLSILMLAVLALAAFLRFYRLPEYMTFLGDEGRDAIVIKNMFENSHFPLIGPPTSVGNIYLGPLYYYMMAIPMAIFYLNPVAAAGMNAVIGVAIVGLIYLLGKVWFGRVPGLIAAYLYAISPVTITYSRSSWNPNPAPFFALISVFSLYKMHRTGNFLWFMLTGLAVGAALQMHYLAAILIPVVGLIWLYEVYARRSKKLNFTKFLSGTLLGISSFILTLLPLIWFDLRHNFLNYRAITELFSSGSAVKADILANIARIPSLYTYNLVGRYMAAENFYLMVIVSLLLIAVLIYKFSYWPKLMLGIWLAVGLLGLTFYQQSIYDHYLGFMNPVPFLLFGAITLFVPKFSGQARWLVNGGIIVLLLVLTIVNLQKSPLLNSPNNQLKKTQDVAKYVISQTGGKDFNFALIAKSNYDSAYQFYLDQYGHKPKQVPFDKTDQLFVVCEDSVCDPTHNAKYEIAAFGMSKIDWMRQVYGVRIYKLVDNPSGKPQ
ncbi:MAG: glycosyltransferase [Candidatus Daviesbacteria bacterium]|nr:glycosyltransferase [Candidatus Daviesbacteria bacterium]